MNFKHLENALSEFEQFTRHQANKGMKKYNQPLDPYEPGRNWLDMEAEELTDAWQYNRAMRDRQILAISKIRSIAGANCKYSAYQEINHWLEFLEGK